MAVYVTGFDTKLWDLNKLILRAQTKEFTQIEISNNKSLVASMATLTGKMERLLDNPHVVQRAPTGSSVLPDSNQPVATLENELHNTNTARQSGNSLTSRQSNSDLTDKPHIANKLDNMTVISKDKQSLLIHTSNALSELVQPSSHQPWTTALTKRQEKKL